MLSEEKNKYVVENFKLWKEKYKFPDHYDFEVRTLFALQYDFVTIPADHLKNRRELLDMILRIKTHLPSSFFDESKTDK